MIAIANHDGKRRAEGLASPQTGKKFDFVVFDLHATAATIPALASSKGGVDFLYIEMELGGQSIQDANERRPVRFAGC